MIVFSENQALPAEQIAALRCAVGWPGMVECYRDSRLDSYWHIAAFSGNRLVGFVDCVSNSVTDAYIQDLMVHPEFQNRGIGSGLMQRMLAKLKSDRISMISVIYGGGELAAFYERFGFFTMQCGQMETGGTVTEEEILAGLRRLGVEEGMMLEVHSSLKSFGHVEGGAGTVISALKRAVGSGGTLFMPALRLSSSLALSESDRKAGILRKIRILPPEAPRSAMGVIADTFRQMPDTCIGEGVFRAAAWGKHAREVVNGFRYPLEQGGKALLLGVDIYSLTAMHYVEDILPKRIRNIFKPSAEVLQCYPPEEWLVETGEPPVKAWHTIQDMAFERKLIRECQIGNSRCLFFDLGAVVGLYRGELEKAPYRLYGLE